MAARRRRNELEVLAAGVASFKAALPRRRRALTDINFNHAQRRIVFEERRRREREGLPPDLCGREAEEGATVAKDSASMQRLEQMHAQTKQVVVS